MEIDDGSGEDLTIGHDDEAVGYGRPPKHTRWKKGQSGNPAGRPEGTRGLKTDMRADLISRMEITMNGKRVSGTKQQLMLRTLTARAAAGDVKATRILIDLVLQVFGPEDQGGGPKALSRTDQQILDELLGRKVGRVRAEEPTANRVHSPAIGFPSHAIDAAHESGSQPPGDARPDHDNPETDR